MTPQLYGVEILNRFKLDEEHFLGAGGESRVYALDSSRIMRIFSPGTDLSKVRNLQQFYDNLDASHLCFLTPKILEIGGFEPLHYSIEPRIVGTNVTDVLSRLSGLDRERALKNYLDAATAIHRIPYRADLYGELLEEQPLQSQSWGTFLESRAAKTLQKSQKYLAEDVPDLHNLIARWRKNVQEVNDAPRHLVHGDFFPGNVMALETGVVTGVIDFSPMTVIGDWRMDLAGSIVFLEVTSAYEPEDGDIALKYADNLLGPEATKIIDLYRIYYSLYFSAAKNDDPALYTWCVQNLRHFGDTKD